MHKQVKGFQGEYRFLSNFHPCPVTFESLTYKSSEAAYQAQKTLDGELQEKFTTLNAREARKIGKHIFPIRADWESEKLNIMYKILRIKFSQQPMKDMLLETEDAYLEETNYWYDTFWGVYQGKGENHLGRLLMLVRDELNEGIV